MKLRTALLLLGSMMLCASQATASGAHKTPTAPADFLSKVSPIKADEADAAVLKEGGKIYTKKCAKCHGETGDGKGSAAGELTIKPMDMSAPGYMAGRKDGQLFWIMMNGSPNTDMKAFGPGSEQNYSEEEIWKVIAYMRANFTK
ncbi:c-type cytochrome [Candidatus Magnetaquicoccus inordinatus]|uniref:c-type cytochrome n=1 Tax=Candidatus Magnetaquicoccus inordinatus TaxID=2496818 RepID=UPI00102BEE3A|nr:c-type cytochrome [Candidatus Magnetaquicoccus inordinatus]